MDRWIEDHIVDHTPGFLSSSERHFLALGEPFVSSLVPPSSIKHTSLRIEKDNNQCGIKTTCNKDFLGKISTHLHNNEPYAFNLLFDYANLVPQWLN